MLRAAVAAVLSAGVALSEGGPRSYESYTFETYSSEFNKAYAAEEKEMRRQLFEQSLAKVSKHNAGFRAGEHSWFMAMTPHADWTEQELASLRSTKYSPGQHPVVNLGAQARQNPPSIDWREKGAVTPVKNQGQCGSCWAFSATESVESHYQIASGKLLELAPQTYVNCVENPHSCGGTGGCEGATHELAFNLTVTSGLAAEADLPYQGRDETCSSYPAAVKASGYVKLPENDAKALETALATQGPVSVTVAAEPWMLYGGGVFDGCSSGGGSVTLDHGVQAVGYTEKYWIVRNSWGPSWGEQGYIYISRANDAKTFTDSKPADGVACKPLPSSQTVGGECGILFDTSYPTGVHAAQETISV